MTKKPSITLKMNFNTKENTSNLASPVYPAPNKTILPNSVNQEEEGKNKEN